MTITQPDLFATIDEGLMTCPCCRGAGRIPTDERTARGDDRRTARDAGLRNSDSTRFGRASVQARVLHELASVDLTAQEVAVQMLGDAAPIARLETARRRVSSLARLGLVADSGARRPNVGSDSPAIVWRITDAGRVVLDRVIRTGWSR